MRLPFCWLARRCCFADIFWRRAAPYLFPRVGPPRSRSATWLFISRITSCFPGVFVSATVHLVLFVMVVRLFSTKRDRDYYFLAVIAFLMVLAAAVLTVDSTFLLAFAAFMLMAVVTCILMEMRHAAGKASVRANSSSDDLAYRQMAVSLAGASPALALLILLGAAAIFFVLPRISTGYLSAFARSSEISTGFSDQVQLGQIGEIQQSNSLVMHIQIDGDPHGAYDF